MFFIQMFKCFNGGRITYLNRHLCMYLCVLSKNQENHITGEGTNIAVSLVYFT